MTDLRYKINLGYDFPFQEQMVNNFSNLAGKLTEDVLKKELESTSKNEYEKTSFEISQGAYQRYDDLSGDYYIGVNLKGNHNKEYIELLNKKISMYEELIKKELELLEKKIEDIDNYYEFINNERKGRYDMWNDLTKDKSNVIVEGIDEYKKEIDKEKILSELNFIKEGLTKGSFTKEDIEKINSDYLDYIYFSFHPIYHDILDFSLFLTDKEAFLNDFWETYPFSIKDTENNKENFDLGQHIKNLKGKKPGNNENKRILNILSPIIETKTANESMLKNIEDFIQKNPDKKDVFSSDKEEYNKSLNIINNSKNIFGKFPEYNNSYYLKTNNISDLAELFRYMIKENYILNDDLVSDKNINLYIEMKFLNY